MRDGGKRRDVRQALVTGLAKLAETAAGMRAVGRAADGIARPTAAPSEQLRQGQLLGLMQHLNKRITKLEQWKNQLAKPLFRTAHA